MEREFYYSKDGTKVLVVAPIGELETIVDNMNRFKFKYDHLLVIGNGFDLNLGLPTTYRNFVESCIFKKMYVKRMQEKRAKGNTRPSLIDYLYGKKFYERWYDIEQALLEYVSKRPDGSFVNNVEEDKKDYELVCESLIEYLKSLFKTGNDLKQSKMMEGTPAGQLLKSISHYRNIIYSFNYTPIHLIINAVYGNSALDPIRIHGEIKEETLFKGNVKDNAIILGIETNDMNAIAPGYSFLIKSNNPVYKSSSIASDLQETRNVIFFGLSLNYMDFGYFDEYFKALTTNKEAKRSLTIITKDDTSRREILDNLRNKGISVREMFTHADIKIILTDDIDNKGTKSAAFFEELLEKVELVKY